MEKTNKTRITKAMRFEDIKAMLNGQPVTYGTTTEDAVDFIEHEVALLAKKNSGENKKQTKTQQENEVIKTSVLSAMEANRLYSISEMLKEFPICKDMSNQKLSSLVRQMVLDKQVERVEDKRKAFFRKVSE